MKTKPLIIAMTLAGAAGAALAAPPIEFSGYMRAGVGVNTRGGNQVCFGLAGADTKFRLGNECDYVVEPTFDAKLADALGKPEWKSDPAYTTAKARQPHIMDIFGTIEDFIKDKTKFEAVDIFRKFDIPCAPVLSMKPHWPVLLSPTRTAASR